MKTPMPVLAPKEATGRWAILTKHAKNFAAKDEARPIFQGIFCEPKDTRAWVSNTHQLLLVKNCHSFTEPYIQHYSDGSKIEGKAPAVDNILAVSNEPIAKAVIHSKSIPRILKYLDIMQKSISLSDEDTMPVFLQVRAKQLNLHSEVWNDGLCDGMLDFRIHTEEEPTGWKAPISPKYLYNALAAMRDFTGDFMTVTLRWYSETGPVFFETEDGSAIALVTPIRVNKDFYNRKEAQATGAAPPEVQKEEPTTDGIAG